MSDDYDTLIDLVAAHRPYGMDCACGRPINSDRDWAHHLAQMLALTEETCDIFTHVCRCPGCGCSSCELEALRKRKETRDECCEHGCDCGECWNRSPDEETPHHCLTRRGEK